MARMVALGPERFVLPLGALGFEMAEAEAATFVDTLRRVLADRRVALVVCGESLVAEPVAAAFGELCSAARAAVLVVPDSPRPRRIGKERTRLAIERAAGVDLLSSAGPAPPEAEEPERS